LSEFSNQQPPQTVQQWGPPQQEVVETPPTEKTNTFALVALVSSLFLWLAGIIFGHIALKQIKRTGERGRGMALAGLIIGYVGLASSVLLITFGVVAYSVSGGNTATNQAPSTAFEQPTESPETPAEEPDTQSVQAGDYTPEFCAALDAITKDPTDVESFRILGGSGTPNAQAYQDAFEFLNDPLENSIDTDSMTRNLGNAVGKDLVACQ